MTSGNRSISIEGIELINENVLRAPVVSSAPVVDRGVAVEEPVGDAAPVVEESRISEGILESEPSKRELFWNVGLLVGSYLAIGVFLAGHLLIDLIRYIF